MAAQVSPIIDPPAHGKEGRCGGAGGHTPPPLQADLGSVLLLEPLTMNRVPLRCLIPFTARTALGWHWICTPPTSLLRKPISHHPAPCT